MATYTKRRSCESEFDGVVERVTIGHERGAGENSVAMRAENSLVNASRETKVICVEDELLRHRRELFLSAQGMIPRMVRQPTDGNLPSKLSIAAKEMLMGGYSFQQNC